MLTADKRSKLYYHAMQRENGEAAHGAVCAGLGLVPPAMEDVHVPSTTQIPLFLSRKFRCRVVEPFRLTTIPISVK